MSTTDRDGQSLKSPATNASDTTESADPGSGQRCRTTNTRTMDPDPHAANDEGTGIAATLCRMALVRSRSLSVNGAYLSTPPTHTLEASE